jgi:precorrin isomerase
VKYRVPIKTEFGTPHTITVTGARDEKHAEELARDSFGLIGHAPTTVVGKVEAVKQESKS